MGYKIKRINLLSLSALFLVGMGVFSLGACDMKKEVSANKTNSNSDSDIIKGEVVVGFNKDVSLEKAEKILSNYNLNFTRTKNVNSGKDFVMKSGEVFIVKVPEGQESAWVDKLRNEKTVRNAFFHTDPRKILLD